MTSRDGAHLTVRPIRPDDADRLVAFHSTLSDETTYMRYFSRHPKLSVQELERFTHVDGRERVALVAIDHGEIVAVGRYDRLGAGPKAEVAFVVADAYQGRGIATTLLADLVRIARVHGVETFVADTLFANRKMRQVFANAGYLVQSDTDAGVVHVEFPI